MDGHHIEARRGIYVPDSECTYEQVCSRFKRASRLHILSLEDQSTAAS
jgi:hypothetical protein